MAGRGACCSSAGWLFACASPVAGASCAAATVAARIITARIAFLAAISPSLVSVVRPAGNLLL